MANTILGIFDDPMAARQAIDELRASPLHLDDISIISRTDEARAVGNAEHISAGEGAAVGAVWGGLVGLAALLIPGVGPFVAGGAIFAALTGAATGAVVGGIAGALIDRAGIPEEDARAYETMVQSGKTLVAVKAHDEDANEVRRILAGAGANSVRDNQTDITGTSAPVRVADDDAAGRGVEQELESGATGVRAAAGMRAMEAPAASTRVGLAGIYAMPVPTEHGTRGINDVDESATARNERINMAAGTEDPYGTDQIPPGDEGRTIETRGWDQVGSAGDRQGERLTPESEDLDPEDPARRPPS
ncbi:MAG TPA: hypothetical protein VGJ87_05460 [Roseiflexaceae bacterium]|jgi:uncharacterized membrane protein